MPVTISLWSTKQGEIRSFLESYYQKDNQCEEYSRRWIGEFFNPLDSIDMISALMDNCDRYNIVMYLHMENGYLHKIVESDYNDVIKGLIGIYYLTLKR